jgi:hypothetical protein
MRFYTRQWYDGALSDEDAETVHSRYAVHRDALRSKFPATVIALAYGVYLHDGRVRRIVLDSTRKTLMIALRCGDLQLGYFDLDLVYQEISMTESNLSELETVARDPLTEIVHDEVDAGSGGRWVHRILFKPYREVAVAFGQVALRIEPQPNREFALSPEPYVEGRSVA